MTMTDVWKRRVAMRRMGATNDEIAEAEGTQKNTIAYGFANLRKKGHDIPAGCWSGVVVKLDREVRRQVKALADEFGKSQRQVLVEIITGAVVDVPDIARNLLDPEA